MECGTRGGRARRAISTIPNPIPILALILTLTLLAAGAADAFQSRVAGPDGDRGSYDARLEMPAPPRLGPSPAQRARETRLRGRMPDLLVSWDDTSGALRSIYNPGGALSGEHPGLEPLTVAEEWLQEHRDLLGLTPADLASYEIADEVASEVGGTTHLYLRQTYDGLPLFNGQLQVNLDEDGRVLSVYNAFLPELALAVNTVEADLGAGEAVARAAAHLGLDLAETPRELGAGGGPALGGRSENDGRAARVAHQGISRRPIAAELMLLPVARGEARLVWRFQIDPLEGIHLYDFTVDAVDGRVWTRFDQVAADSYRVYPQPVESPIHTAPLPPADARVLVVNPAHPFTSPFGWHDTNGAVGPEFTVTRGNNVESRPPAGSPNCGPPLLCDFPVDFTQPPAVYQAATATNLFYWANLIHDVQYLYGFDPPAGNFQVNNYGLAGLGNDDVLALDQPGCVNNAFFSTPPDGSRPTMWMCIFNITTPAVPSSFDAGVIVHEYGHGISNRLVGGPGNVSCLNNLQQPGEGLSDWWSLVYTHEVGDQGTDARGIGNYVLGLPPNGPGIRTQPYSTDPAVNTHTYASIAGMSIPHGVGEVWAQGAWEAYWSLVDKWGFDPNLYNPFGGAGNQRMKLYVNEGLKFTPCGPAFTDVRDGILQAATVNYGGIDVCRLWTAFAAFGLGSDAISGGPNSTNPTDGFAVPVSCQTDIFSKDCGGDTGIEPDPACFGFPMWTSPDIVVRNTNTPGPHQNPEFGQTNYIRVAVRQRSTVEAHNAPVKVYYANASTGLAWPTDWTEIGQGVVTSLAPGNDTEIVVPWDPPGTGHYCLLARIDTGQDPMTHPETANIVTNTQNNNNIVWKNVNIVDLIPGLVRAEETVEFIFRNPRESDGEFFLRFVESDRQQSDPFLERGQVTVVLSDELAEIWAAAGQKGDGIKLIDDRTFFVVDPAKAYIFVPLRAREEHNIAMIFSDAADKVDKPVLEYEFHVIHDDANSDENIGGITYHINALTPQ